MRHTGIVKQPSATILADDLIDLANRLHYQASSLTDRQISDRLRDLAAQIEEIAKEVDRCAQPDG